MSPGGLQKVSVVELHCSVQNSSLLLTLLCAVFCSVTYAALRRIQPCYIHCSAQYSALLITLFCAVFCSAIYTALRSILLCYVHCSAQYSALLHILFCAVFCYIHFFSWCLVAGWICVSNNCGSFYRAHCPALNDEWMKNWWSDRWQEKTWVRGDKSVPVPLCPTYRRHWPTDIWFHRSPRGT